LLVQNHRQVIPDFYGLTTSFLRSRLKPSDVVLGDEEGAPWVKYINGNHGKGTWTFFGGHDPADQQHQIGDPPTDLSLHAHSPCSRFRGSRCAASCCCTTTRAACSSRRARI